MLEVRSIHAEYPGVNGVPVRAARDISFSVANGQLFSLLGPSGCGKTTTLRSIAGLEWPTSGEITVDSDIVFSSERDVYVAPHLRQFGMVFQSYAIWPHMNVYQNVAFPLEVRRPRQPAKVIREKVVRVLEAVGLDHLIEREATKLSGGQQQRLALARALIMEPRLLLLDEPLSNLDAKLREKMRFELKRIQRELQLTTIYVTHDQSEALALSHEIAVMNEGEIVQIGSARDIYERPASKFVADFVGTTNFLDAVALDSDSAAGTWRISTPAGDLTVVTDAALSAGQRLVVSVRPEDIHLAETPDAFRQQGASGNFLGGVVAQKIFLGEFQDFKLTVGTAELLVRAHPGVRTPVGQAISLMIRTDKCLVLANA